MCSSDLQSRYSSQTNNIYNGASFQHATILAQQTFAKDRESIRINYSTISHSYATPVYYSLKLSSDYISYLLNLFYPDTSSYYFLRKQLYRFLEQEHLLINQDAIVSLPYSVGNDWINYFPALSSLVYRWCSIIPNDSIPLIYLNSTNFYYYLIFDNFSFTDNRQFTRQVPFALSHFTGYTTYTGSYFNSGISGCMTTINCLHLALSLLWYYLRASLHLLTNMR